MKTFEQFDIIDEKEKLFIELAHLDELDIKFDFIFSRLELFYFYKKECYFNILKKDFATINKSIWSRIGNNHDDIEKQMNILIYKFFGYNCSCDNITNSEIKILNRIFNL
ncbi:hypothetical protein M0Q50_00865 [bacterium]|jgi:hypothetical protein|nr:hypothetical protein [bacterium]